MSQVSYLEDDLGRALHVEHQGLPATADWLGVRVRRVVGRAVLVLHTGHTRRALFQGLLASLTGQGNWVFYTKSMSHQRTPTLSPGRAVR
jgi:hypothetical protein